MVPTASVKPAEFRCTILRDGAPAAATLVAETCIGQLSNLSTPQLASNPTLFQIAQESIPGSIDSNLVTIILPKEVTIQNVGSTIPLLVDQLTYEVEGNRIVVGGTLHLPGNQPAGSYSGNYTISINRE